MSSITSWKYTVQAVPSKKKKNFRKKRGKENEVEKRRRRKKGWKEFVQKREKQMWKKRRKEERENEGEGERDERGGGRERRIENGEGGTRNVSASPDTFPSTKLGNNMTLIKRRLGKNTTPTSRSPTKLNQDLQVDPWRRRSNFDASSRADFSYAPEEAEYPKYKLHSNEAAIYMKAKTLGNPCKRFKFSINQH